MQPKYLYRIGVKVAALLLLQVPALPHQQEQYQLIPQASSVSKETDSGVDFTVKVINPQYKREAKTYMLHSVPMTHITTFKEIIFEQLGKNVVCFSFEFDVGYIVSSKQDQSNDDIETELNKEGVQPVV